MKYEDILIPEWCEHLYPTNGIMGCWSLISGDIKEPCKTCDCYKKGEYTKEQVKAIIDNQNKVKEYLEAFYQRLSHE